MTGQGSRTFGPAATGVAARHSADPSTGTRRVLELCHTRSVKAGDLGLQVATSAACSASRLESGGQQ
jgi:hypothetical protein